MSIVLRLLAMVALTAAVLFGAAGRCDLPFFWAYVGVVAAALLTFRLVVDPDLQRERLSARTSKRRWRLRLALAPFVIGHLGGAGLDVGRFHWSDSVPLGVQAACLAGFAASLGLVMWAMAVNRFFSPAVSLPDEGGPHVVTAGPYGYVRHPGYLGMILAFLCSGPALGSWVAMLPAAGYVLLIALRTATEDRFLHRELAGYGEYAKKVRFRLAPYVW